jgi:hypothetical protein
MYVRTHYRSQPEMNALAGQEDEGVLTQEEAEVAKIQREHFTGWWLVHRDQCGPVLRWDEKTVLVPWAAPLPPFFNDEVRVTLPFFLEGVAVHAPKALCQRAEPLR